MRTIICRNIWLQWRVLKPECIEHHLRTPPLCLVGVPGDMWCAVGDVLENSRINGWLASEHVEDSREVAAHHAVDECRFVNNATSGAIDHKRVGLTQINEGA